SDLDGDPVPGAGVSRGLSGGACPVVGGVAGDQDAVGSGRSGRGRDAPAPVAHGSRSGRLWGCGGRGRTVVACPGPCRVGRVLVGCARPGGVLERSADEVGRGERCRAVVDDRGVRVRGGAAGGRGHGGLGGGGARARGCVDGGGGAARVAVAGAGREVADGGCAAQVSHGPGEPCRGGEALGGVGCVSGVGGGGVAVTGSGVVRRRLVGAWRAGVGWENEGESPVRRFPSSSLFGVLWCLLCCLRVCLRDRKSTRLNSSHVKISYAVFCLKKKKKTQSASSHYAAH